MNNSKNVYILMTQTDTKFSRLLKLQSKYPYNHVSIALDKDLKKLYSFGRRNIHLPIFAGFVQEDISGGIYALYKETDCVVYQMTVSHEEYENIQLVIETFLQEEKRYRYNILGIIAILLGIPVERPYHFLCSQFVAYVLEQSQVVELPKPHTMVRPQDFDQLGHKQKVYQGKLLEYQA